MEETTTQSINEPEKECISIENEKYNSIYKQFRKQAEQNPTKTAIRFDDQKLAYQELANKAQNIANQILNIQADGNCVIAICVSRGPELIVSLMGILQAGGAYLPIDPRYPTERIEYILKDSNVSIILTDKNTHEILSTGKQSSLLRQRKIIVVDKEQKNTTTQLKENTKVVNPQNLAYVIYTSGSTGDPKGVMITQRSILLFLNSIKDELKINNHDTFLALTSISFDISVLEIFLPLVNGLTIVLAGDDSLYQPNKLIDLINDFNPTVIQATPTTWRMLNNCGFKANVPTKILCGGEPFSKELGIKLLTHKQDVWCLYGPTEATVWTTAYKLKKEELTTPYVYIGSALSGVETVVLDENLCPIKDDTPGELYIGGNCLALGYTKEELNKEKFITLPFELNQTFYRTGDIVKQHQKQLEFVERIDDQVKINGKRIELGGIEAVLSQHPDIAQCCIITKLKTTNNYTYLVAFVVLNDSEYQPTTQQLRSFLANTLPDHEIPNQFIILDRLPVTPNQKIDRKALKERVIPLPPQRPIEKPETSLKNTLTKIFSVVLGIDQLQINTYDSFFDIGGTSAQAIELLQTIHKELKLDVDPDTFFKNPSLETLCKAIKICKNIVDQNDSKQKKPKSKTELPLSSNQQQLWVEIEIEKRSSLYNSPFAFELKGKVNVEALEKAFLAIIARHDILRANFKQKNGIPFHYIKSISEISFNLLSIFSPNSNIDSLIKNDAIAFTNKPFNLENDLLISACIWKLSDNNHLLVINTHHLINDGWSEDIFRYELYMFYSYYIGFQEALLPDLELQYSNFILWQRAEVNIEHVYRRMPFWLEQLENYDDCQLDFPTDFNFSFSTTQQEAPENFTVPADTSTSIKKSAKSLQITPFIAMLSAFQILLYRYSGQKEYLIGTATSGRTSAFRSLQGLFVNILPIKVNINGEYDFSTLAINNRNTFFEAYKNELPFELLLQQMDIERKTTVNPLIQVGIVYENQSNFNTPIFTEAINIVPIDLPIRRTNLNLVLYIKENIHGFDGRLEYNPALFKRSTIQRIVQNFNVLLQSIANQSKLPVNKLPIQTQEELELTTITWNQTQCDFPLQMTLADYFETMIHKNPEYLSRTAIIFEGKKLTYKQLHQQSNRLAHFLKKHYVTAETVVAVYMSCRIKMIISIFGILKAGGAFLILDCEFPSQRIGTILEDSNAALIVTETNLKAKIDSILKTPQNLSVITVNDKSTSIEIQKCEKHNISRKCNPDNLAYIIYTSGTTGQPKGVEINHQGVTNLVQDFIHRFAINTNSSLIQVANPSFDGIIAEIFPILLCGACLNLIEIKDLLSPTALIEYLKHQRVTHIISPPSFFQLMIENNVFNESTTLKEIVLAGEVCPPALGSQLLEIFEKFTNGYGPTEATVAGTLKTCQRDSTIQFINKIPIGKPVANKKIYILDELGQQVPIGVIGVIHIGGIGLARGYRNNAKLTKLKFINHPLYGRLYNTGDLGKHLENGDIEFHGRIDEQIKIRGFRIELTEIANRLMESKLVSHAAVTIIEDSPNKNLAAYVVPNLSGLLSMPTGNEWETTFETTYQIDLVTQVKDPLINFIGWKSTYTGKEIPLPEMQEWVNATVKRIQSLAENKEILEIGCGLGLLLFRLLPTCKTYTATDISYSAIRYINEIIQKLDPTLAKKLIQATTKPANRYESSEIKKYDLIIINSVVQYFEDVDYLIEVLNAAVSCVKPGGTIFIGDVRLLELLEDFALEVEFQQSNAALTPEQLLIKSRTRALGEKELVISPSFFQKFAIEHPRITGVISLIKRGKHTNELTKFRYDVILYVDTPVYSLDQNLNENEVTQVTHRELIPAIRESKIPILTAKSALNSRTTKLLEIKNNAYSQSTLTTCSSGKVLLHKKTTFEDDIALDPETLFDLAEEFGYEACISFSSEDPYYIDITLIKKSLNTSPIAFIHKSYPYVKLTNTPAIGKKIPQLPMCLQKELETKLPCYMLPAFIIVLEEIPLTPNGKVDYKSLPYLNIFNLPVSRDIDAPNTDVEMKLISIVSNLTGISLKMLSLDHNFFTNLGGNSLLAIKLAHEIAKTFMIDFHVSVIFEQQVLKKICYAIQNRYLNASKHSIFSGKGGFFKPTALAMKTKSKTEPSQNSLFTSYEFTPFK